jgi:hypothetical protein
MSTVTIETYKKYKTAMGFLNTCSGMKLTETV